MSLTQFSVDDGPHNMDGLRLFAWDGSERVEAFIGRKGDGQLGRSCRAPQTKTKSLPWSIQCAWEAEPCSDSANCEREIPARCGVQPPAELLALTVERAHHMRVLLVISARPEFTRPWPGYAHVTTVSLTRLSRREETVLITGVAQGRALPEESRSRCALPRSTMSKCGRRYFRSLAQSPSENAQGRRWTRPPGCAPFALRSDYASARKMLVTQPSGCRRCSRARRYDHFRLGRSNGSRGWQRRQREAPGW
jgi:hypothetical protein